MSDSSSHIPFTPKTPDAVLEQYVRQFHSQNPIGVSMSTASEILEMELALRKAVELYRALIADGKIDLTDLNGENIQKLVELSTAVSDAVKVDGFDINTLTKDQIRDLLQHLVETVFIAINVTPSGTQGATYKDLAEIMEFIEKLAEIFDNAAKDGTITWTDLVGNIGTIIDLTKLTQLAFKIDGKIQLSDLTLGNASDLISRFISCVYGIVQSAKQLK